MKLNSFSIKNYRSIFNISKLDFSSSLTTLIGKNNQGKSNILHAISLIFDVIKYHAEMFETGQLPWRMEISYDWKKDFPIQRQNNSAYRQISILSLDLCANEKELQELKKSFNIPISKYIILEVKFGKKDELIPNLTVHFKNHKKSYNSSDDDIVGKLCSWILNKISYQYIPAIRTDKLAEQITNNVISLELSQLSQKKRDSLEKAFTQIRELQKPILDKLEKNLSTTLKDFVPEIRSVSIEEKHSNYMALRRYSNENDFFIRINDGSETVLSQKGDGVKSLITLGMMRQKGRSNIGKGLILAIEEPESHLHPEAIRQISRVINDISKTNQIIITSHSPLFVNRDTVSDNIIVENNSAKNASNMKQIRNILGVIASDNLINSEFSIVVEGETDKKFIQKYISEKSLILSKMFEDNRLNFEILNGIYNLENSLNKLNNMSSKYFCILDSDQVAKANIKKAKEKALLTSELKEVAYYTIDGLKEAELEDLINPMVYENYILKKYGIKITDSIKFCSNKKIWSERVKDAFKENGKMFENDDISNIIEDIKIYISNLCISVEEVIIKNRTSSLENIVIQLENYFENKKY